MRPDRRRLLRMAGAAAPAAALPFPFGRGGEGRFLHGVASGDPLTDRAILWTRVTPDAPDARVRVSVEAFDAETGERVFRRTVATGPDRDHTVKIDARGLKPGRTYRYRFLCGDQVSPEGRVRALPEPSSEAPVVLAFASCALWPGGLFNAYDAIARLERVDAVVHLGDYIYEYGAGPGQYGAAIGARIGRIMDPPHEILTLADYRRRHALYKSDPDLQAAHARAAFICVNDDHEVANDGWSNGAENHGADEGAFAARKAAAYKAWMEWMPVREPGRGASPFEAASRAFRFGRSASLHMLETRYLARSRTLDYATDLKVVAGPDGRPAPDLAGLMREIADPGRMLLGAGQSGRLAAETARATADGVTWQVFGNQVVMAKVKGPDVFKAFGPEAVAAALEPLEPARRASIEQLAGLFTLGVPLNLDAWDGYPAERDRFYALMRSLGARPVVVSGDSHAFWVNSLTDSAGARVGTEFGVASITSPPPSAEVSDLPIDIPIADQNEDVIVCDMSRRGFVVLTLSPDEATAELVSVSTVLEKPYSTETRTFRLRPTPGGGSILEG